jgi:hypothetical protein
MSLINDSWTYRGVDLYAGYDTRQVFRENYEHGLFMSLSPWHTHGRINGYPRTLRDVIADWFKEPLRPQPKPPHRLVALLKKLPPDERVRHWKRFESRGVI